MKETLHILVIDDDMVDRLAISRALHKSGLSVQVSEAASIQAAWERIELGPWDCVFLDYLMPGGDGLDLLQQFRAKGHQMPIVIVTSQGDEKVAVEVMKAGGSDYITKNLINSEAVANVVRRAIRIHLAEAERLATAQALADSEARLAEAQRIANIGSWEMDATTLEEFWTEQVFMILGEPVKGNSKMGRRTLKHHILQEDIGLCIAAYQEILDGHTARKVDVRILNKAGKILQVEIQGKPVFGPDQKVAKIIGTIQDITARKAIEQALRESRDLAERNAKTKEEFLANMSHEIRTPMNAILGFAKLLQETQLDAQQHEYLQAIDTSGEALLAIISDILDLSKIEAGMMRTEAHPFSIPEILQTIKNMFRAKALEKHLEFNTLRGPGVPDTVIGDAVKLKQVLLNLVANAFKFTEDGEVNVECKLVAEDDTTVTLLFEVADTGIGIAGDQQEAIFASFTQATSDTTRKYGGTGLGLTICRRIVELQGGRIGLDSELGEGSTFFFELRFDKSDLGSSTAAAPQVATCAAEKLPTLKVLLAEDNKLNQRLATIVLERLGFTFRVANSGREALDLMTSFRPDIVLMDIQMPEMDGYEATRMIRKLDDPSLRLTPIIALTAYALQEEVEKCKAAGMNGFIAKPFQTEQLKSTILQLIHEGKEPPAARIEAVNSATESHGLPALDLRSLDELVDGNAQFRQELIGIFLEEVPKAMRAMQHAITLDDAKMLYQAAHLVKPSLLLFGVPEAAVLIRELEAAESQKGIPQRQQTAAHALRLQALRACEALKSLK